MPVISEHPLRIVNISCIELFPKKGYNTTTSNERDDPMRILVLSCNTGEGHNSCGKAIMDVLKSRDVDCEMQDALACLSPSISKFICDWFVRIYRYMPKLFNAGYTMLEKTCPAPDEMLPVYEALALGAKKLKENILAGDFDAVICTHTISGMMLTQTRKKYNLTIPSYFVSTDYTCHPTAEHCNMDAYFIPDESLIHEFLLAGLPEEKLIPTGIPIRQPFFTSLSKEESRQLLDLPESGTVVLLMCGSMGCGPIERIAKEVSQQLEDGSVLIAVCGSNKKLYDTLEKSASDKLRVLGFTTQVPEYMDASDLIITKPGGLSSTEAATKGLPMVFINTVGGCEQRNLDFFSNRGFATGSADAEEVIQMAVAMANDKEKLAEASKALDQRFRNNGAVIIADLVMDAGRAYRESLQATL